MLLALVLCLSVHLAYSINNTASPFLNSLHQRKQMLCELGCKCPETGQILTFLDCSRRGISNLPTSLLIDSTFNSLSFKSNHLESLKVNTFTRADEVQELDFSLNMIAKIDNYTFAPFMSLVHLRLSHNRLSQVTPGMLNGLWNLRLLELGHNFIERISFQSFQVTPNLQELRLQYNPLFNLPENVFRYLHHLEKLDLKDTGLVLLPDNVFRPTPRLHWLSLAMNAFENVPEEALSHAPHLEILDLSENDFTILVEGAFRRLSSVSVLYLNNLKKLTRIEREALAGLEKLKTFSCSYNPKLSYIDENAFGSIHSNISKPRTPPREMLYLRQNALRTLKSPLDAKSWSSLSFVDLADNPWKCDCKLNWMMQLTKETKVNIKCDTPLSLRSRTFDSIDSSELHCNGNWAIATFALVVACMVAFAAVMLAVSAVVCSRTPVGLYVRAKQQFSYDKVQPKTETVDLEWDPSADM